MGHIRDRYLEALKETQGLTRSYWLNFAFLDGHQWVWFNKATNQLDAYNDMDERIRPTINRMRSNFRTLSANATQRALSFEVLPEGADDHSVQAARLAERLLEDLHQSHSWEAVREKNAIATFKGGTAAICVDWDEDAKTTIETPLSIADFVVQPGVRDAERAVWWIKAQALPPEEVKVMFGLDTLPPADATSGMSPLQERLVGKHFDSDGQTPNLTLVLTYYERPTKLNPKGKFYVEVDNRIVEEGDWSFPFKNRLNLVITTETPHEDRWYGSSFLDDVRPIQVAYNLAWANLLEHMADASSAKLLLPQSAMALMEQITDTPGEMLTYPDGTEKPAYLNPPQLAGWIQEQPGLLALAMDDLMGVHDVSRGAAPANIESGYGLSILAEKDATPVGRFIKECAHAWSRLASMVLQIHQAEVREKRSSVIKTDGGPLKFEWTGKDISGQTNAKVPEEAIMPRSRAAMQAFADKAMQMQLVKSLDEYARIAELPGQAEIVNTVMPAVAKAQRENSRLANGEIVIPATFDDHAEHIRIHNNFRMTEMYELLPLSVQEIIDEHVQAHETLAAEAMGRAVHQAQLDPNLAQTPNADGSPPPEIMPEPAGGEEAAPAQDDPDMLAAMDPEAMTTAALNALEEGGAAEAL
jgi:hypothetical protein